MDERHHTPSGAVIKKLCERACSVFNETEYENIATISVSHIYNLRGSCGYQKQRRTFDKTQSRQRLPLVKGANLMRKESLAIFEWIPFIKAIRMA